MALEVWPLSRLIPDARNPRTHSPEQVAQIAASIQEFGWTNPILVDKSGVIIAGHGRYLAAPRAGLSEAPVIVLGHLTESQRRALLIADNKLALNAGWDDNLLAEELAALEADGFDMSVVGFSDEELAALLEEDAGSSLLTDPDDIPEAPAEARTRRGDLYLLGRHRLLCGDATSEGDVARLMDGARFDLAFTSPPYNAGVSSLQPPYQKPVIKEGGATGSFYLNPATDAMDDDVYRQLHAAVFVMLAAHGADDAVVCYNLGYNNRSPATYVGVVHAANTVIPLRETVIWDKNGCIPLHGNHLTRTWEFIFIFAKGELKMNKELFDTERNMWKITNAGANHEQHAACFPVELPAHGIRLFAPEHGIVCDPFAGTGTTIIAAEGLGRACYALEIEPRYCDVIVKRWEAATGRTAECNSGEGLSLVT